MNITFSFRERFFGLPNTKAGGLYAPLTIGSPQILNGIDRSTFKKSKDEKELIRIIKAQHKDELIKSYGKGNTNRKMNP